MHNMKGISEYLVNEAGSESITIQGLTPYEKYDLLNFIIDAYRSKEYPDPYDKENIKNLYRKVYPAIGLVGDDAKLYGNGNIDHVKIG
jgi:hypothetical protein